MDGITLLIYLLPTLYLFCTLLYRGHLVYLLRRFARMRRKVDVSREWAMASKRLNLLTYAIIAPPKKRRDRRSITSFALASASLVIFLLPPIIPLKISTPLAAHPVIDLSSLLQSFISGLLLFLSLLFGLRLYRLPRLQTWSLYLQRQPIDNYEPFTKLGKNK